MGNLSPRDTCSAKRTFQLITQSKRLDYQPFCAPVRATIVEVSKMPCCVQFRRGIKIFYFTV